MKDKTFRTARLIRLAIFLGILFSFAWMFRWELGNTVIEVGPSPEAGYVKLDRWTGTTYHCVFRITSGRNDRARCLPAPTPLEQTIKRLDQEATMKDKTLKILLGIIALNLTVQTVKEVGVFPTANAQSSFQNDISYCWDLATINKQSETQWQIRTYC